jgi:hypothetical protein
MFQTLNQIFMKTKIFTFLLVVCTLTAFQVKAITVTVGATGSYPSISAAIAGVGTITEPLIIELTTDYAQTTDDITAIDGASATNTVTIRPQGTLVVAGTGAYVWRMNGCKYVTIDGRVGGAGNNELTLRADTLATSKNTIALLLENDASFNRVQYLNLRSAVTLGTWRTGSTSPVDKGTIMFGNGILTGNSNNIIEYCDLGPIHPYTGAPSTAIYSKGNEMALNTNLQILNNKIYDYYATDLNKASGAGVQVGSGVGVLFGANTSNCTISGNSFYQTLPRTAYGNANGSKTGAIIIDNNVNGEGFIVKDNYIGGSEPMCGGSNYINDIRNNTGFNGIYLSTKSGIVSAVYNNTLKNLMILSNSPIAQVYQCAGISVNGGNVLVGIQENGITPAGNNIGDVSESTVGANASIKFSGTSSNATFTGILLNSLSNTDVKIANNKIAGVTVDYFNGYETEKTVYFVGINVMGSATGTILVENNQIGNNAVGANPTSMSIQNYRGRNCFGIYTNTALTAATIYTINGNKINNMYKTASGNNQTYVNGIWINTAVLCPVTITNNEIRDLVFSVGRVNDTPLNWSSGITLGSKGTGSVVSNNQIYNIQGFDSQAKNISGITILPTASSHTSSIFSNQIFNLSSNVTRQLGQYGTGCNGILTSGAGGGLAPVINIYNNMIRLGYDRSGNEDQLATNYIGIRDTLMTSGLSDINYIGNTIYIGGSNVALSDSISSLGMCFASASTATRNVKNNLIVNARSNTTVSGAPANKIKSTVNAAGIGHYAIGTGGSATALTNFISNNNNYVAYGTGGVLGRFTSKAEAADLAAIQSYTGGDLQSIADLSPIFIDATGATPDLHLNQTNYNYNEGLKFAAVLPAPFNVDFDGNARHATNPTIGGDEYTGFITGISKNGMLTLIISVNGNDVTVQNTSAGNLISVYNISGQNVKQLLSHEGTTSFNMKRGIYLIKVNNEVAKIVI